MEDFSRLSSDLERLYSSTSIRQKNSRVKPWGVVEKKHNWQGSPEIAIFGEGSNKQPIYGDFQGFSTLTVHCLGWCYIMITDIVV